MTVTIAEMIVSITAAIALIMLLIARPMADTIDPMIWFDKRSLMKYAWIYES